MIDIAILASSAVTAVIPYLLKGGEAIAGEAGKNLFSWIKEKLHLSNKEKEISALQQNPADPKIQGRIEVILENILSKNSALITELSALIQSAEKETSNIISNSKNVNTGTVNAGGNVTFGDNNNNLNDFK